VKLGVALGWHALAFEELLDLVRRAEAGGFAAAFVDGDVSQLPSRPEAEVLDGWTVTATLLALTERIQIGSIRLIHHWNPARLAQAAATLERIAPDRFRFLISIGGQPADQRFGLPLAPVRERIAWLDEALWAIRRLWQGEEVSAQGAHFRLSDARIRPCPPGGRLPIAIAAARPRMLELVATHADVWDVNLPPIASRVRVAEQSLERACRRHGRDPAEIGDDELAEAIVSGPPESCQQRIREIAAHYRLDLPIVDLSGLSYDAARLGIDAFSLR
jgi:alkanesulfonate monooxygenase SsuD/methylene tetrahydromethanopterin reductase-like flavin-dependent oxidoreductase (luciferase family)